MIMKQKYLYIYLVALAAVFSCVQIDESSIEGQNKPEFVPQSFTATIELPDQTKATLDGSLEDGIIPTVWQPSDKIKVFCNTMGWSNASFINVSTETSETALFEGMLPFSSSYIGLYPYQDNSNIEYIDWIGNYILSFVIPEVQTYSKNTFDPSAAIMVAKSNDGVLEFKHLCGFLAVQMKGQEKVKSITFMPRDAYGKTMNVAGGYRIDLNSIDQGYDISVNTAVNAGVGNNSITLTCPEPVALSKDIATPFYFVLPPADYSAFTLLIETEDGQIMIKEGKNPLTVTRSHIKPTSSLGYAETVFVDLSERGHSNCYIVPQAGLYSFDADVAGNGEYGYIDGENFYPASPSLKPASAEVLWQDRDNVVTGVSLDDGKINFMSLGIEGNALIAVRDAAGNIIWNWHIWMTDQPAEHHYKNDKGEFVVLDRYIGATRADRGEGDQWRESMGLVYQWGRKEPFWDGKWERLDVQLYPEEIITMPTTFVSTHTQWTTQWSNEFWSKEQKTVFDPCPVGYRVAVKDIWAGFTTTGENAERKIHVNAVGSFDYGWNFRYDGENTAWYPVTSYLEYWGYQYPSDRGYCWSADNDGDHPFYFEYYYQSDFQCNVYIKDHFQQAFYGYPVRCMKDDGHVDISFPKVKTVTVRDISSTGATIVAKVEDEGLSSVTERGFIWGRTEDLSDGTEVKCGNGAGEFTTTLNGLEHSTRYYFKAYAVNGRGRSESKVASFYTPYSGGATDLSANGTANCYIVPPVYSEYVFNCMVKGNSSESVGTPASAEVLWETRLDYSYMSVGSVIETVELVGNFVKFRLPFDTRPGNALIAVKDANGSILWSWHIWVVDFDPEQTGCKLISGAKVMDRNLGALNVIPEYQGAETTDYSAYGLYYQWGRKDPAPLSGNILPESVISWNPNGDDYYSNVDATIKNPTHFVAYVNYPETSWSHKKTVYDPCPAGWRVPDVEIWNGISNPDVSKVDRAYRIIPEPYSTPQGYYPMGGRYYAYWPGFDSFNDWGYWWGVRQSSILEIHWSDVFGLSSTDTCLGLSVRCMKYADMDVTTNEAKNIKGTSAEISGSVKVNDGTRVEATGFEYMSGAGGDWNNPDHVKKVELSASSSSISTILKGLTPQTTYWVRAYVKGGFNTIYGNVIEFTTTPSGDGEGFDNGGDFEWE